MGVRYQLVAVVPVGSRIARRLRKAGFGAEKANGRTETLTTVYEAEEHAMADGHALDAEPGAVWAVEPQR